MTPSKAGDHFRVSETELEALLVRAEGDLDDVEAVEFGVADLLAPRALDRELVEHLLAALLELVVRPDVLHPADGLAA